MLTIQIETAGLLDDIRKKSRQETSGIEGTEERYRIQVGSEKNDELFRDIQSVSVSLAKLLRRWIISTEQSTVTDECGLPSYYEYKLDLSERRVSGKGDVLMEKMREYIIHYALAKYYASVSATELSNVHSQEAFACSQDIESSLSFKVPPTL